MQATPLITETPGFLGLQSMTGTLPAMSPRCRALPLPELLKFPLCPCRDEILKPPSAKCGKRYAIHLVSPGHLKS
jgi:hypothetical protein